MGNPARTPHRWSIVVARIAAIDIRVHASFLVLVVLFVVAAPEPGLIGVLWSLAWLLVIFGSVVLHELAHCVVARTRGAEVHEILLFPLGGISKLDRLPETPRDEFAVAIVGSPRESRDRCRGGRALRGDRVGISSRSTCSPARGSNASPG